MCLQGAVRIRYRTDLHLRARGRRGNAPTWTARQTRSWEPARNCCQPSPTNGRLFSESGPERGCLTATSPGIAAVGPKVQTGGIDRGSISVWISFSAAAPPCFFGTPTRRRRRTTACRLWVLLWQVGLWTANMFSKGLFIVFEN